MQELSEQEIVRREALQKLIGLGIDPYPAAEFPVNILAQDAKEQFAEERRGACGSYDEFAGNGKSLIC
jgi:lysyl-tRNA synthetase class 2